VVGLQGFFLGCIGQVLFDYSGRHTRKWLRIFAYTRSALIAFGLVIVGIGLAVPLVVSYFSNDFQLTPATAENHLAVTGLALAITGAQVFVFTLLLHGTVAATRSSHPRETGLQDVPDEAELLTVLPKGDPE
jgi:TRAP-type C4-dicarboxylate transport system permease small subunit